MATDTRAQTGFYCSTSGTYFDSKDALAEHYKSDFHRYNLKRKVAGLPPVTKEWFEARKAQLTTVAVAPPSQKTWVEPLSKKKFATENTYQAFIKSKKYLDLVKKSGQPAPEPLVVVKRDADQASEVGDAAPSSKPKTVGYKVLLPKGPAPPQQEDMEIDVEEGSDWETASDDSVELEPADAAMEEGYEEWDVCRSLFDNHVSKSFDANLEYMFKNFGFYFPDAQYLRNPEGLLKYLGAKVQQGRVPIYTLGDDPNAKQFRSLHAVQRHMVDTNQCKMVYDGNEEEYAEFYDYEMGEPEDATGGQLALADGSVPGSAGIAGYELVVGGEAGGKVLGSRDLARYYKQRHKPEDERQSVVVNTMLAKYRALGIATQDEGSRDVATKKEVVKAERHRLRVSLIVNQPTRGKLLKNVPY